MYFIREPGHNSEDTSSPVKGLDEPDSLQSLQDKDLFERKLEALGCLKAEVKKKQDEDEDAIMAHVKRRKVEPESAESDVPLGEQPMQIVLRPCKLLITTSFYSGNCPAIVVSRRMRW